MASFDLTDNTVRELNQHLHTRRRDQRQCWLLLRWYERRRNHFN